MPIVFEGRVFSVDVETVRLPDGREHRLEIVRHRPSVVLLPMPDDHHVILVRQYRPSVHRELWELPAGSTNEGESAESAAARECEEEVGPGAGPDRAAEERLSRPRLLRRGAGLLPSVGPAAAAARLAAPPRRGRRHSRPGRSRLPRRRRWSPAATSSI